MTGLTAVFLTGTTRIRITNPRPSQNKEKESKTLPDSKPGALEPPEDRSNNNDLLFSYQDYILGYIFSWYTPCRLDKTTSYLEREAAKRPRP